MIRVSFGVNFGYASCGVQLPPLSFGNAFPLRWIVVTIKARARDGYPFMQVNSEPTFENNLPAKHAANLDRPQTRSRVRVRNGQVRVLLH